MAVGGFVCLRLAAWQCERGRASGSLLHYTYAAEWVLLAAALVVALLMRRRNPPPPDPDQGSRDVHGRLIGPPLRPGEQLSETTRARLQRRMPRRRR